MYVATSAATGSHSRKSVNNSLDSILLAPHPRAHNTLARAFVCLIRFFLKLAVVTSDENPSSIFFHMPIAMRLRAKALILICGPSHAANCANI